MRLITASVLSAAVLGGCASGGRPSIPEPGDVDHVLSWMTGSFSSDAQAAADPEFRDIRLHMARIWSERSDGAWVYVEQAAATTPKRPYRQRVYRLTRGVDGRLTSEVFLLPGDKPADVLRYAGAWNDPALLAGVTPDMLRAREGCTVYLRWIEGQSAYVGATEGAGCGSELAGAAYATSEVRVEAEGLVTWDRGFDASGAQVWGAVKGPYQFRRRAD